MKVKDIVVGETYNGLKIEELGRNYGVVGSRRHRGYTDFNDLMYGKARYVKNRNT